jgi:hypothetical protein
VAPGVTIAGIKLHSVRQRGCAGRIYSLYCIGEVHVVFLTKEIVVLKGNLRDGSLVRFSRVRHSSRRHPPPSRDSRVRHLSRRHSTRLVLDSPTRVHHCRITIPGGIEVPSNTRKHSHQRELTDYRRLLGLQGRLNTYKLSVQFVYTPTIERTFVQFFGCSI